MPEGWARDLAPPARHKGGPGESGGEDGCDDERPRPRRRSRCRLQHARALLARASELTGQRDIQLNPPGLDPLRGSHTPPGPQGKTRPADRIFTAVKGPYLRALFGSLAVALAVPALAFAAGSGRPRVLAIHFELEVNPVTSSYLDHQLDRAQKDGYDAAVIVLDTPGGLSDSMRTIVKTELTSKIPVIVYVSPPGRAPPRRACGSARRPTCSRWHPRPTSAPRRRSTAAATNIQQRPAAQGDQRRSRLAARPRQVHGRNAVWAELAVRKASNLTAEQALQMNVIDVVAPNLPALLEQIDGRKTVAEGLRPAHRGRADHRRASGLLHAPPRTR